MKKKKKYQIGGIPNIPTRDLQVGNVTPMPQNIPLNDYSFGVSEGTGELDFHPLFKLFNILAQGTTGIANKFSDINTDKKERLSRIKSLQEPNYTNPNKNGLNNVPVYAKNGGWIKTNPENKGDCTPMTKSTCTGKKKQFALTMKKHHGFHKKQAGGSITPQIMEDWNSFTKFAKDKGYSNNPELNSKDKQIGKQYLNEYISLNPNTSINYGMITPIQEALQEYRNNSLADIKAGKGAFGQGVNENNYLANLSKVDNWLGINTINSSFPKAYINNYHNGKLLNKENKGFAPLAKLQAGGTRDVAELEEGEVMEDGQGNIDKIPEGSGTHEEGGTIVPDVQRVLEDTSDKRKDKASKLLRVQPNVVEELTGFKPKSTLSHAKAHEKATEFYNKKSKAIELKLHKNTDRLQEEEKDQYAYNSMKFNLKNLKEVPTKETLFDPLFEHQENVKSLFGITDSGKKGQYGFQAYKGDKKWKGNASKYSQEEWNKMAEDLGYKGGANTRAFQEFLLNQDGQNGTPDIQGQIINLHDKYGNPNTPPAKNTVMNWTDNRLGHRWDVAYDAWKNNKQEPYTPVNGTADDYSIQDPAPQVDVVTEKPTTINQNITTTTRDNRFNMPLKWYDVAGSIDSLLSATKAHIGYNPAETHQIDLQEINPLPQLQKGQSDFNAELAALASTGVNGGAQLANAGNLFARKYALNNEVLGNTANQNSQIRNQETIYNAQSKDRQSLIDQQARSVFQDQNLATDEAVRQQKLTSKDSLYTRIAQNAKFNREGNLLMKLFPNFTPQGDYNGKKYQFRNPLNTSSTGANKDIDTMLIQNNIDPSKLNDNQKANILLKVLKLKN